MTKKYLYEVEYASGILRKDGNIQNITSNKKLNIGSYIVVEHIDCGVFIAKVIKEIDNSPSSYVAQYRYLQYIDLSKWENEIERKKRLNDLKFEMEIRFSEIDEELKFEKYAEFDDKLREMYLEYKELSGEKHEDN